MAIKGKSGRKLRGFEVSGLRKPVAGNQLIFNGKLYQNEDSYSNETEIFFWLFNGNIP